jgi:hypothetical protein
MTKLKKSRVHTACIHDPFTYSCSWIFLGCFWEDSDEQVKWVAYGDQNWRLGVYGERKTYTSVHMDVVIVVFTKCMQHFKNENLLNKNKSYNKQKAEQSQRCTER